MVKCMKLGYNSNDSAGLNKSSYYNYRAEHLNSGHDPRCIKCGSKVLIQNIEKNGVVYCCSNCIAVKGLKSLLDSLKIYS